MWSKAELTALGEMVMNFAALDACVDRLLAGFITESAVGEIIVAGEAVSWKFEKLAVIARECLDDESEHVLIDWVKAAELLNERRNKTIHSWFADVGESGSLTRMKASTRGGKWRAESETFQLEQIQELVTLLEQGVDAAQIVAQALRESGRWHGELRMPNPSASPA